MRAGVRHLPLAPRPSPLAPRLWRLRSILRAAALAAALLLPQACGFIDRLFQPEEYKPIMNTPRPAVTPAVVPAVPVPTPPPLRTPAPPAADAARPGNPMSWGEAGQMGVGREFDAIYFNGQTTELDPLAKGRLTGYVAWLKDHPQVWITLAGHADRHISEEYAYNLGMARALAVADYLAAAGLEARRIYTISYGKARPASDGTEPADDALNSRVEVLGFVAPLGQDAPAPAGQDRDAAPDAEKPAPPALGRDLTR